MPWDRRVWESPFFRPAWPVYLDLAVGKVCARILLAELPKVRRIGGETGPVLAVFVFAAYESPAASGLVKVQSPAERLVLGLTPGFGRADELESEDLEA